MACPFRNRTIVARLFFVAPFLLFFPIGSAADQTPARDPATRGQVLWSANSHPEETSLWEVRGGIDYDPHNGEAWLTLETGMLPRIQTRPLRLTLLVLSGPSPMGQFREQTTDEVTLGLSWTP